MKFFHPKGFCAKILARKRLIRDKKGKNAHQHGQNDHNDHGKPGNPIKNAAVGECAHDVFVIDEHKHEDENKW
ncbi:MAG: hypothetical protein ABIJ41_04710 [Candidatus Omnitrophota bacterium]